MRDLHRRSPSLASSTPVALRISSRPSTTDNTPQPASFYLPDLGHISRQNTSQNGEKCDTRVSVPVLDMEGVAPTQSSSTTTSKSRTQEGQSWAHIVDFYDAFSNLEEGGVALMVEYMDGGSLQDIVETGGCDDESILASIAQQALLALEFLHTCNQLHRDLKPANMLINQVGSVKLSDFGIMRQLDTTDKESISRKLEREREREERGESEGEGMQRANTFVGTVTYMAPERIDGREYSYPSDIWSLGLSLLTLALGKIPFDTKGGFWSILHTVRDTAPPSLPSDSKWSDEFRDFTALCLKQNPDMRPSCSELLKHPFILKAKIDPNIYPSEESALHELRSIIFAMYQHVMKLQNTGGSVLLEACRDKERDHDILDTMHRILFAESRPISSEVDSISSIETNKENSENCHNITMDPSVTTNTPINKINNNNNTNINNNNNTNNTSIRASARLGLLASQLHLPVEKAVQVAREIFAEIDKDKTSTMLSLLETPKAHHGPMSTNGMSSTLSRTNDSAPKILRPVSPLAQMLENNC